MKTEFPSSRNSGPQTRYTLSIAQKRLEYRPYSTPFYSKSQISDRFAENFSIRAYSLEIEYEDE